MSIQLLDMDPADITATTALLETSSMHLVVAIAGCGQCQQIL